MSNQFVKTLVLGVLLSPISSQFVSCAEVEGVLIHNQAVDLTKQKVLNEFLLQPVEIQGKLKKNEIAFRRFIDAINNESLFEIEANKQNLKADPVVAQKIEVAIRKALIGELIAKKTDSIKVPNMEPLALAEYKAHPEKYRADESVNARHILLTFDANNKAEKMALMETISKKVAAGEKFTDLAKQYSDDKGSAVNGGELGAFVRGKTVKPFEDAAFALKKPGQLSDVVESQFGLHLIELIERTPAQKKKFEAVKADIIESKRQEYLKNEINNWRDAILDTKNSSLNEAEISKLVAEVKKLP